MMPNKTSAVKRRSKGSVASLQTTINSLIREVEARVLSGVSVDELARLSHAASQLAAAWSKLHTSAELEGRLERLEALTNE